MSCTDASTRAARLPSSPSCACIRSTRVGASVVRTSRRKAWPDSPQRRSALSSASRSSSWTRPSRAARRFSSGPIPTMRQNSGEPSKVPDSGAKAQSPKRASCCATRRRSSLSWRRRRASLKACATSPISSLRRMSRHAVNSPSPTRSVARRISWMGRTKPRASMALAATASSKDAKPTPTRLRRARWSVARSRSIEEPACSRRSAECRTVRESGACAVSSGSANASVAPVSSDQAASDSGASGSAASRTPARRLRVTRGTDVATKTAPRTWTSVA